MKKLIFGIALFVTGIGGIVAMNINIYNPGFVPRHDRIYALLIIMIIAGFVIALWEVFFSSLYQRWCNSPVELSVYVDGKKVATLRCPRGDKKDRLIQLASELPEVKQVLSDKKIVSAAKSALVDKTLHLATSSLYK